jgi:hypothetical protein
MRPTALAVALLLGAGPSVARADGCKFGVNGRLVPEREQRALVEWADGTETLYVATLSDKAAGGSVWVVPVRAAGAAVRAEPVDEMPAVLAFRSVRFYAAERLRFAIAATATLDSGGLCCPLMIGGCGAKSSGAVLTSEVSRVEKLGMVVTVVTADTRAGIEAYLDAQGVDRAAADLSSLDPYFGRPGFAFACGWAVGKEQPVTATGLRVVFPSPNLWFPLLPTRAYTNPVRTVVYARGVVKPAPGCDLPGLTCDYVQGWVMNVGVGRAFEPDHDTAMVGRLEQLTRVTLTTDPRKWDRDLELVPGATPAGTAVLVVAGWGGFWGPLWSALLGAVLGLAGRRRPLDWLAGAATGAAIILTVWASLVVFVVWRNRRFGDHPDRPRWFVVLPLLAAAHFAVVALACQLLLAWVTAGG